MHNFVVFCHLIALIFSNKGTLIGFVFMFPLYATLLTLFAAVLKLAQLGILERIKTEKIMHDIYPASFWHGITNRQLSVASLSVRKTPARLPHK